MSSHGPSCKCGTAGDGREDFPTPARGATTGASTTASVNILYNKLFIPSQTPV